MSKEHKLAAKYWYYQALKKHILIHIFQFAFDISIFKQSKELDLSYFAYSTYGIEI